MVVDRSPLVSEATAGIVTRAVAAVKRVGSSTRRHRPSEMISGYRTEAEMRAILSHLARWTASSLVDYDRLLRPPRGRRASSSAPGSCACGATRPLLRARRTTSWLGFLCARTGSRLHRERLFALLESHGNTAGGKNVLRSEPSPTGGPSPSMRTSRRRASGSRARLPAASRGHGRGELALGEGAPPRATSSSAQSRSRSPRTEAVRSTLQTAAGRTIVAAAATMSRDPPSSGGHRTPPSLLVDSSRWRWDREVQAPRLPSSTLGCAPGESVRQAVMIELPEDLDTLDIEVMLAATDHFELAGESFKTLTVQRDEERSANVPFHLRVRDDAPLDNRRRAPRTSRTTTGRPAVFTCCRRRRSRGPGGRRGGSGTGRPEELASTRTALPGRSDRGHRPHAAESTGGRSWSPCGRRSWTTSR